MTHSATLRRDIGLAVLAFAAVAATSVLGQIAVFPNLGWYATLAKPAFSPPNACSVRCGPRSMC
jgi:tryptophan-rich sensory protein